MGADNNSISSSQNENKDTQVVLNVYDLTPVNNYTYWFGFGIFHSGIEGLWTLSGFCCPFFFLLVLLLCFC